ncbi:Major facilitator superfamily domain-containing protein 6 [Araneus ventricosus]|uniref:Major facilitator superfamily domain-containing protein 6 n=1 Tax=Araneus ventricosus TaxID=182803 RepID=A0A4Y2HJV0_ARAVE|nr:Major facilitator superfamily domain-containing protein 6 [Araneus ventricosus]
MNAYEHYIYSIYKKLVHIQTDLEAALGSTIPFVVVFAKERLGLAATSMGAVLTAQMILFIFTKPLIGYIADYFNKLKFIICVLTILNMMCYFLMLPIPKYEREKIINSSSTFEKIPMNASNTDHNFKHLLEFIENKINFSMTDCSDLNFAETQSEDEIYTTCSFETNWCLNVPDNLFPADKIKNNVTNKMDINESCEYKCVLFFNQNDTLNISLPTYNNISSDRKCLGDGKRLFYSKISESIETNRASENNEFFMYLMKPNGSVDMFTYCSKQNLSRENLLNINAFKGTLQSDTYTSRNNLLDKDITENGRISDFKTYQFWMFAFLFSFSSICTNAIFTLSDTACCETIQKTGAVFGRQRMWGSIGWGVVAPIAGLLNDYTEDFLAAWILMAISLLLFLWNISKLDLTKPQFSKNILRDVGTVLRSKEFLAYEAVILMNGFGTGLIWFYLIWFLRTIGGSELLCGLCLTVQSFGGAIPLMFFSGQIIRKCGHFQLLSLSLMTYIIRFVYYSQLYRPWWILPLEFSHGITFGLYYTVIASYGKLSSKPGTEATTQSILFSTHEGLGASIGCVFAGIGFDHMGGHETFFIAGIFFVFGFVISLFLFFFIIQKQKRTFQIPIESPKCL